ncbi:MAG TPA: acyl-CoA dehydrogenase family protein [Acidimicrobiales bacterium]|nr:acyl-CoA dehydrogenase family protein [Acidimicrobiales bacterium]
MRFGFDDDQLAMRDAVRSVCVDRPDPADAGRWRALADLGVLSLLDGGPGAEVGIVEAALVFEELGAHLIAGPVLWSTLASPLVAGAGDGHLRVAGVEAGVAGAAGPVVVEHGAECDVLVVLHPDRVERCPRPDLVPEAAGAPLDPGTPVGVLPALPAGEVVGGPSEARDLWRHGAVLAAALLVGAAQGALDLARDYAAERHQFGVPIGSFQAVKHLLADMYVRVELARAATWAAAASLAGRGGAEPDRAAGTAKLLAGEAGVGNGRTAVQVLGGMGFTWDMPAHRFLKRAWVLEHAFGTAPDHAARLGAALGDGGS